MSKEYIDQTEEYISELVDVLNSTTKNSLEKIAILEKSK